MDTSEIESCAYLKQLIISTCTHPCNIAERSTFLGYQIVKIMQMKNLSLYSVAFRFLSLCRDRLKYYHAGINQERGGRSKSYWMSTSLRGHTWRQFVITSVNAHVNHDGHHCRWIKPLIGGTTTFALRTVQQMETLKTELQAVFLASTRAFPFTGQKRDICWSAVLNDACSLRAATSCN